MNDYIEVKFKIDPCSEAVTDVLAALLADRGFESFIPDEEGLTAFAPEALFNSNAIAEALDAMPFDNLTVETDINRVEGRDWNAEWERHYFNPIVVGNRCVVHSSFHTDVPVATYDIVIDPKMAFGTGHHATTSLILEQLLDTDLTDLNIIDMGTGTAILAILAAMRGASHIDAIEIDPFAEANARENLQLNGVASKIDLYLGDASVLPTLSNKANLLLANINRNVILADLPAYAAALAPSATVLFSGFYNEDAPMVAEAAEALGLKVEEKYLRDNWCCLKLRYSR